MAVKKEIQKVWGGNFTDFLTEVGMSENVRTSLLKYKGSLEEDNNTRIFKNYPKSEREKSEIIAQRDNYTLEKVYNGTILNASSDDMMINQKYLFSDEGTFYQTIQQGQGFYASYLDMIGNDNYARLPQTTNVGSGKLFVKTEKSTVWVWSRQVNKIINISNYIESLTTNVDGRSNSFNLSLSGLKYKDVKEISSIANKGLDYTNMSDDSFFYNTFRMNDIIFIRFETLKGQDEREESFIVNESKLASNFYDFIGFVDNVSQYKNYESNDSTVSISGRGLNKVFQDDVAYFYPRMLVGGVSNSFVSTDKVDGVDKWLKRSLIGIDDNEGYGQYDIFLFTGWRSVSDLILFIITQVSNLSFCDSSLFNSYKNSTPIEGGEPKDRRSTVSKYISDENVELEGIWQIVNASFDDKIIDKGIKANFFTSPEGNLESMMNKVCQYPFIEWFTDTYYDKMEIIVRQPPFIREEILECLGDDDTTDKKESNESSTVRINESDIYSENVTWNTEYYSSYKIDPTSSYPGANEEGSMTEIPIIYSPTIANIYGNKMMELTIPYIPLASEGGRTASAKLEDYQKLAWSHLKWAIKANCYLPFTEKGSITIKGDRRIKARTWIRLPKGKIGFVTSVTNNVSYLNSTVDRMTTVNLERIMYEKYVRGSEYDSINEENELSEITLSGKEKSGETITRNISYDGSLTDSQRDDLANSVLKDSGITSKQFDLNEVSISPKRRITYWSIYNLYTLEKKFYSSFIEGDESATVQREKSSPQFGLNKEIFKEFIGGIYYK